MIINLPRLEIKTDTAAQTELLLVGGGRAPSPDWLAEVAANKPLWCIDHGLDICHTANLAPERLIGDNDSVSPESFAWAEHLGIKIVSFPPEKDFTDTQLALQMVAPGTFVLLTGAFGGRFDHLFSTINSFAGANISGVITDEKELLLPLTAGTSATLKFTVPPKAVSLLPLSENCTDVSISGTKWPLTNQKLARNNPYAVSNEIKKDTDTISVSVKNGILSVYLFWG